MIPTPEILIVSFYTGLNAMIFLWLTAHVGQTRGRLGISVGDGGNAEMIRAMRGQANFVECVPVALLLLLLMALMSTPGFVLHIFGVGLTLGRIFHALHFTAADAPRWQRSAGAGLTILLVGLAALGVVGHSLYLMVIA